MKDMKGSLHVGWVAAAVWVAGAGVGASQVVWQDVIRNLRHPSPEVRIAAVDQLNRAGYVAAAEPVAALVMDPDDRVQLAAIDAELSFFLLDRFRNRTQQAFEAGPLVRAAGPAPPVLIDKLIAAMRDENERIRFDAVHALGAIAEAPLSPAQLDALVDQLEHYDPIMRAATCRVFARLGDGRAAARLIVALGDSSPIVRQFAIDALGRVRAETAVPHLVSILIRERGEFAPQALLALARIAPASALDHFRKRLTDRNAQMRRAAVEGIGRLGDREALATLQAILKNDRSNEVRLAAHFALNALGEVQTHHLAAAMVLRDLGGDARDYLLEIGRPAIPGIESALKVARDARHRADLVQLIGFLGTRDDTAAVRPFLTDRNARVVRAADNTIARLNRKGAGD
jgi:HEAT repeat protein